MDIKNISSASPFDSSKYVAEEFLEGNQSNVRIIRLAQGTVLPPHRHGDSDLMLFVQSGAPTLEIESGPKVLQTGDLVFIASHEELRISNDNVEGVTLLAFLTPKFPPRS